MDLNTLGWILSNNERDDTVIQRDDEMGRFKDDDEATEFVAESYLKMLDICRHSLVVVNSVNVSAKDEEIMATTQHLLVKIIAHAEGQSNGKGFVWLY